MEQIGFYRNKIRSAITNADALLFESGKVEKESMVMLTNLLEAFTILANISGDANLINEAKSYEKKLDIYELGVSRINEGFTNPFADNEQSVASYMNGFHNDSYNNIRNGSRPDSDDIKISRINLWDTDTANKIMFKNGVMVAGKYFGRGDIIERCPIRLLFERDMYSENIRKFAFALDRKRGIYAVPFGYASFYRNSKESGLKPNCEYEYVIGNTPEQSYIKIYATEPIKKNEEIILLSDETDFENEIKPGQFKYDNDVNDYTPTKNFKIL